MLGFDRVATVREKGEPLGVSPDPVGDGISQRPRLGPFSVSALRVVIQGSIELCAARGRQPIVKLPSIDPVYTGQDFVGRQIVITGRDPHLGNNGHLRQKTFLRRQSYFGTQIKILGTSTRGKRCTLFRVVQSSTKFEPIGKNAVPK